MAKRGGPKTVGVSHRYHVTPGVFANSLVSVVDNSGAKVARVISVIGNRSHGVHRKIHNAGVGDMIVVSVVEGKPEVRKQKLRAIVVRQRRPFRRHDGTWVAFDDNAVVIVSEEGQPKGTEIHGPIAMEAAQRWPQIASLAALVI